jgi:hypothetical protein
MGAVVRALAWAPDAFIGARESVVFPKLRERESRRFRKAADLGSRRPEVRREFRSRKTRKGQRGFCSWILGC